MMCTFCLIIEYHYQMQLSKLSDELLCVVIYDTDMERCKELFML